MRVPTQRASRSGSATSSSATPGKRISSSSSSAAPSSGGVQSVKKRKLHSDASTTAKSGGVDTAGSSKKKVSGPLTKKSVKKGETGGTMKTSAIITKKLTPRKAATAVLSVGLKRSKTKIKKIPSRKISVVTIASKAHKKIVKSVKTLVAKKHLSVGKKGNASAADSGAGASNGEERVKTADTTSEDVKPPKRPVGRPPLNRDPLKTAKGSGRKPKANTVVTASTSINRAKKIEQKNISLKKKKYKKHNNLPKYTAAIQENHQQVTAAPTEEKKKGKVGRKKLNAEVPEEKSADKSPDIKEKDETVEQKQSTESDGQEANKNQNVDKPSGKVGIKKTKDEDIPLEIKMKKLKKKKPKIEAESIAEEEVASVVISETAKENKDNTPKKDGKEMPSGKLKSELLRKKQNSKLSDSSGKKIEPSKKSLISKPTKIVSTKLKKTDLLSPKSSKKKPHLKTAAVKEQFKITIKEENPQPVVNVPERKCSSDNGEDSSTSDEITLDMLLRQHLMKQEAALKRETVPADASIVVRSHSDCGDSVSSPASTRHDDSGSRMSEIISSPATAIITSDEEDLKSIKNRIKVKIEKDSEERSSPLLTNIDQQVFSKDKENDSSKGKASAKKDTIKDSKSESKKSSQESDEEKPKPKKILGVSKSPTGVKRVRGEGGKGGNSSDTEQRARRMKLFGFWSGPKRHRVASLNALAKVHCLYENESRGALYALCSASQISSSNKPTKPSTAQASSRTNTNTSEAPTSTTTTTTTSTRTLRSAPGLRGMGKHWDMHNALSTSSSSSSSSDENDSSSDSPAPSRPAPKPKVQRPIAKATLKKNTKQLKNVKKVVRRRRNKGELMMDLKDMVVRKRMASLNASAILAASYSMEKRSPKVAKEEGSTEGDGNVKKKKKKVVTKKVVEVEEDTTSTVMSEVEVEECGSSRSVIEVRTTPSNSSNKVAVIVNQDTDVTITGVYVNSTTRSTHHEGYCSIAGMQYRISSTSHTQTEATAVATETVLHTSTAAEHPTPTQHPPEQPLAMPMKSYTPLGALSSMQPPGAPVSGGPAPHHHHIHPHPHPHPHPPCNVPPQQPPPPPPPPPHRGPANPPPISPLGRRHGCASAFSAPPSASYGPPPPPPPPPQHHQQPPPHHHPPHPPPPPPQGQQDPAYIHGYYQPAGPLISTHHHHSSSSSSTSASNAGKAVVPTLEASPNPTPPPPPQPQQQPPSSSSATTTPQQIVSVTSASGGGDESSDNDVIITATSCSGGGETHPPPPPPHHPPYRYPQSYPTPSTPQHIHHQSYTYNYPHTQYYPSPPASASIQYSANPPGLQQHHHYHNQDLCYTSGTPSYPPASYFHHKSYTTPPPPPTFHRRYIQQPPAHQYYPPDLYAAPASNGSQQSSAQSQQSQQQMVVTGSTTGSASSYQLGVSSNPPLVETYPPPVSIVDPYPPPPGYYAGYSAGPGAAGCYSHSPPTRSLAFIDAAAYQTCPCPMQSCPKNVHTGPLTGDGKGPHLTSKQSQPPPQESGASFHQLPLPPVALALPLEPPGALGPPSPARGSAGMPPPPSPATASARNPSHTQERSWESSNQQEAGKSEPKVSETHLKSSVKVPQELQNKPDNTTLSSEEARHRLLAISNIVPKPEAVVCRTKSKKRRSPPAADTAKPDNNVPLLMCDHEFRKKRQNSSDIVVTKVDEVTILDTDLVCDSVKTELKEVEKETETKPQTEKEVADCLKADQNDEKATSRKRKLDESASKTAKTENEATVPKRRKPSNVGLITNGLLAPGKDSAKTSVVENQDKVVKTPTSQTKCKNAQKSQPLSSNSSLHNSKQQVRKRKLDDGRDLAENKEPQFSAPVKKKSTTKVVKLQKTQMKVYPSRVVPSKKVSLKIGEVPKRVEEMVNSALAKNRTVLEPLANAKRNNSSNLTAVNKKTLSSKNMERKKSETRINGTLPCSKKASQKLHTTKVQHTVNSVDAPKSRASQCASNNRATVEVKKGQHKKKSETVEILSTKKSRATNSLRSQLRDSLSDQTSSDDSESLPPKGKSSLVGATRRTSSGSRKEQVKTLVKKPGSTLVRNDSHKKLQQSQEQQMDPEDKTNQEASQILAALSRRSAPKKTLQMPKWSNGWKFEGEPFENRVFLSSDDIWVIRKCYPLMRHEEGDVICPWDCILLKSGPRKTDLPFVAKVAALWENPEDGEMMVSLLWYYRPEHTDHGRRPDDMEDEIFASKHKDINSVACIEDKCYVLTFNEYCRYRKCVRRLEDGVKEPGLVVPQHYEYPREGRQPPGCVAPELVFFCRRVYDFRQRRILKNPG